MDGFRTWIRDVVEERTTLRINVPDANEVRIAYMTPITRTRPASDEVVEALTRWRNRARRFFLTQFEATVERTRGWLESVVLTADDRLFFLLYTDSGKLVGHYGFIHMDERSAEVDNLMRGESGGPRSSSSKRSVPSCYGCSTRSTSKSCPPRSWP